MLDIHTVSAGGGTIARIDAVGGLQVGPDSAGAGGGKTDRRLPQLGAACTAAARMDGRVSSDDHDVAGDRRRPSGGVGLRQCPPKPNTSVYRCLLSTHLRLPSHSPVRMGQKVILDLTGLNILTPSYNHLILPS